MFNKIIKWVQKRFTVKYESKSVLMYIPSLDYFPVLVYYDYNQEKLRIEYEPTDVYTEAEIYIETEKYIKSIV